MRKRRIVITSPFPVIMSWSFVHHTWWSLSLHVWSVDIVFSCVAGMSVVLFSAKSFVSCRYSQSSDNDMNLSILNSFPKTARLTTTQIQILSMLHHVIVSFMDGNGHPWSRGQNQTQRKLQSPIPVLNSRRNQEKREHFRLCSLRLLRNLKVIH